MKLFALTGGIGTGKSTLTELWQGAGVEVVDTDVLARELVEPGNPALAEISEVFGSGILDDGGRLRREELARLVFGDSAARQRLEGILHPRIQVEWRRRVSAWREAGAGSAVVVIPLLFEKQLEQEFDCTVAVGSSEGTQRTRLMRRGWSAEGIRQRMAAQLSVAEKMRRADRAIWNEGSLSVLGEQARRVLR